MIFLLLPLGHENMTPVHLALEVALHELNSLHGLHVTDVPDLEYTWDINNLEAIELIEKARATLHEHTDNDRDIS